MNTLSLFIVFVSILAVTHTMRPFRRNHPAKEPPTIDVLEAIHSSLTHELRIMPDPYFFSNHFKFLNMNGDGTQSYKWHYSFMESPELIKSPRPGFRGTTHSLNYAWGRIKSPVLDPLQESDYSLVQSPQSETSSDIITKITGIIPNPSINEVTWTDEEGNPIDFDMKLDTPPDFGIMPDRNMASEHQFSVSSESEILFQKLSADPGPDSSPLFRKTSRTVHGFGREDTKLDGFVIDTSTAHMNEVLLNAGVRRAPTLANLFTILKSYRNIFQAKIREAAHNHLNRNPGSKNFAKFFADATNFFEFRFKDIGAEDMKLRIYVTPGSGEGGRLSMKVEGSNGKLKEYDPRSFKRFSKYMNQKKLAQDMQKMLTYPFEANDKIFDPTTGGYFNKPTGINSLKLTAKQFKQIFYFLAHVCVAESAMPSVKAIYNALTDQEMIKVPFTTNPALGDRLLEKISNFEMKIRFGTRFWIRRKRMNLYSYLYDQPKKFIEKVSQQALRGSRMASFVSDIRIENLKSHFFQVGHELELEAAATHTRKMIDAEVEAQLEDASNQPGCSHSKRSLSIFCTLSKEEKEGRWQPHQDSVEVNGKSSTSVRVTSEISGKVVEIPLKQNFKKTALHLVKESFLRQGIRKAAKKAFKFGTVFNSGMAFFGIVSGVASVKKGEVVSGAATSAMSASILVYPAIEPSGKMLASFGKALAMTLQKSSMRVARSIGKVIGVSAKRGARIASLLSKSIGKLMPLIGFAFDVMIIKDDYDRLHSDTTEVPKWLIRIELGLDFSAMFAGFFVNVPKIGIYAQVLVFFLTVVRIFIEPVYTEIAWNLNHCEDEKIVECVMKGYVEGIADVFTGGYTSHRKRIIDLRDQGKDALEPYIYIDNYAKVGGCDSGRGYIDFTRGKVSYAGGDVTFWMTDDGHFHYSIPIPVYGEAHRWDTHSGRCNNLRDIILGAGKTLVPVYEKMSPHSWGTPSDEEHSILNSFGYDEFSARGSYVGNRNNNFFYAPKAKGISSTDECKVLDQTWDMFETITSYKYKLFGQAGNDTFFLGPQRTVVTGGSGHDAYIVSSQSNRILILNHAMDELDDLLFVNVSMANVSCEKQGDNLVVNFCFNSQITIMDWFYSSIHRHLVIKTKEGHVIAPLPKKNDSHLYECLPQVLDFSLSKQSVIVDLEKSSMHANVFKVIGSKDHAQILHGNSKTNVFIAGKKDNYLMGRSGSDQYIVADSGIVTINNCDNGEKLMDDHLLLNEIYDSLQLSREDQDIVIKGSTNKALIRLEDWFTNISCQHLLISTFDNEVFQIKERQDGSLGRIELVLDFREEKEAVQVFLKKGKVSGRKDTSDTSKVITMISSSYSDTLVGHDQFNVFECRGKKVTMKGLGGVDIYKISKTCENPTINACSFDNAVDQVYTHCNYDRIRVCPQSKNDDISKLMIFCTPNSSPIPDAIDCSADRSHVIEIAEWKTKSNCRGIEVISSDGVTLRLGNFSSAGEPEDMFSRAKSIHITRNNPLHCSESCVLDLENYTLGQRKPFRNLRKIYVDIPEKNYQIYGNSEPNIIQGGQKKYGSSSYLEGRNGSDTYIILAGSLKTELLNFAEDMIDDFMLMNIKFENLIVSSPNSEQNVLIFDEADPKASKVVLIKYWKDPRYQHLIIKSEDGIVFRLSAEFPHKSAIMVDTSFASQNRPIQVEDIDKLGGTVSMIQGSEEKENVIFGSDTTKIISGGLVDDYILGGPSDEALAGHAGNDSIDGMGGNDVLRGGEGLDTLLGGFGDDNLYGGGGSDVLIGGPGQDTIFYEGGILRQGSDLLSHGVSVSLLSQTGYGGDAEGDWIQSIENIVGSAFNDSLEDDDGDNHIFGGPGDDRIISHGGLDTLHGGGGKDIYDLRLATGIKKIRNYDYYTKIEHDVIQISSNKKVSSPSIKELVQCSLKYMNDLFVVWNEGLVTIFLEYGKGINHQHLVLKHNERKHNLKRLRAMINQKKKMSIASKVTSVRQTSIELEIDCFNCPTIISVFYSAKNDSKAGKQTVNLTQSGSIRIIDIHPGTIYSFMPIILMCGQIIERGPIIVQATKPGLVRNVVFSQWLPYAANSHHWQEITDHKLSSPNSFFKITWQESSGDPNMHSYLVMIKYTTESNGENVAYAQVSQNELIFTPGQFGNNIKSMEILIKSRVYGTLGDWHPFRSLTVRQCSDCTGAQNKRSKYLPPSDTFCMIKQSYYGLQPLNLRSNKTVTPQSAFNEGQKIKIQCNPIKHLSESEIQISRCTKGQWMPPLKHCPVNCLELRMTDVRLRKFKNQTVVQCPEKLFLVGPEHFTCEDGKWEPKDGNTYCVSEEKEPDADNVLFHRKFIEIDNVEKSIMDV